MYLKHGQSFRDTGGKGAPHRRSYIAPCIIRNVEASLISVLAHIILCVFLSLDSNVLEEVSFTPGSAPPDLSPLCSFSCIKQHSILFPSFSILLPWVVHLPSLHLTARTWPPSLILILDSLLPLSAGSCVHALSNTTPVPTKKGQPLELFSTRCCHLHFLKS